MATTLSLRPRAARLQRVLIVLTAIAMVLAILPIAAAVLVGNNEARGSAFAQAPSGQYAVVARTVESTSERATDIDIISVVNARTGESLEVATVPHLPGFTSSGAVSPRGSQLALVVPDSGSPSRPLASLILVDLESGATTPLTEGIDVLQEPVWVPASNAVVVTATESSSAGPVVRLLRVTTGGEVEELRSVAGALGIYPVGFDAQSRLVTVQIDGRGSTVYLDDTEGPWLSPYITRDWSVSPDGTQLAFVETNQDSGLAYLPRVVALEGGGAGAQAFTAGDGEALGSAWSPGDGAPVFGGEPGSGVAGTAGAQSLSSGFDIPLAYSADGSALAVKHWSGTSFDAPGSPTIQLVTGDGRESLDGISRFFGWATR